MAAEIFDMFDSLTPVLVPVNLPKGGTTYMYAWNEDTRKEDWRADGYRWRQNGSFKDRKCGAGSLCKTYFKVFDGPNSLTGQFTRTAYTRPDKPNTVVIVYAGDESVAAQFPHGLTKKGNRIHIRTQPHVLRQIESTSTSSSSSAPSRIYQTMVTAGSNEVNQATSVPRNIEQVRNCLKYQRNRGRLSRDAFVNLHELAMDSNFIQHITTYPDLSVILYHPEVIKIFKQSLSSSDHNDLPTQQLSYDTTFNLGDFYVSVLLFHATDFESQPVIPLAYLIHERKLQETHDHFFSHLQKICPEINTAVNVVMMTDQEKAINDGITKNFPNLKTFLCWNHIQQDCKRWLRNHGVSKADEISVYLDNIKTLFASTSFESYMKLLLVSMLKWSQPFSEYYMSNIHVAISKLGLWELQRFNLDQSTTNQSESFNLMLKRLHDWKEAPIDAMALSLLRLADFQLIEIKRGYSGLGNFVLREGLIPTQWVPPTSHSITYSPEEIVDRIRSAGSQQSIEDQPVSPGASNSETPELPPSIASTTNDRPTTSN